jgi:hypothetical protein
VRNTTAITKGSVTTRVPSQDSVSTLQRQRTPLLQVKAEASAHCHARYCTYERRPAHGKTRRTAKHGTEQHRGPNGNTSDTQATATVARSVHPSHYEERTASTPTPQLRNLIAHLRVHHTRACIIQDLARQPDAQHSLSASKLGHQLRQPRQTFLKMSGIHLSRLKKGALSSSTLGCSERRASCLDSGACDSCRWVMRATCGVLCWLGEVSE